MASTGPFLGRDILEISSGFGGSVVQIQEKLRAVTGRSDSIKKSAHLKNYCYHRETLRRNNIWLLHKWTQKVYRLWENTSPSTRRVISQPDNPAWSISKTCASNSSNIHIQAFATPLPQPRTVALLRRTRTAWQPYWWDWSMASSSVKRVSRVSHHSLWLRIGSFLGWWAKYEDLSLAKMYGRMESPLNSEEDDDVDADKTQLLHSSLLPQFTHYEKQQLIKNQN